MNNDNDWNTLLSYLPSNWEELASTSGAMTRQRGFSSPEVLLRTLLIHLAQGCSLRETAVRARRGAIADVSDVAILKRLRKSEVWLHKLCQGMCDSSQMISGALLAENRRLIAVDATCVSEPGSTGTNWKLHYALELPSLACLHFELTDSSGAEQFRRFPLKRGDLVLADRAYCTVPGIKSVLAQNADVLVRMKLSQRNIYLKESPEQFDFISAGEKLNENETTQWDVAMGESFDKGVLGRLCIMKRPDEIAELDRIKILREAKRKKRKVRERTLRAASFVGLFCTTPKAIFSANDLFAIYRFRWQVEIAFKRLKTITDFGHLPKHDPSSCRAWLYGKLLVGLLAEKMAQAPFFP